jgi:hypothetical protein
VTALEELRAGKAGEAFIELLGRTIRAVANSRGFPPPEGHLSWGGAALQTAVSDFLSSPQTARRLTDLATHCRTDQALAGRLQRTVRNYLADQGRRTPVGRLVLRFNDVLRRDEGFERHGRYWALLGQTAEPAAENVEHLAEVIRRIDVVVPKAWATGGRQSPELDAASVVTLARAMLESAGGALRTSVMAQAVARRLSVGGTPLSIEATAFDPAQPSPISNDSTGDAVIIQSRASEVLELLNDHERLSIGLLVPLEDLGRLLGVSRSKAHLIRKRATAILENELRDEEGGQAVADLVLDLARIWSESWTI